MNIQQVLKQLKSKKVVQFFHARGYFIPSILLSIVGLLLFGSAGRDDAHITYWPAYTLANFGEILNYNGVRIEQSSSLLQVVLLGILAKVTSIEVMTLGKITSIVFGMASVALTATLTTKITADRSFGFSAALITAVYPYFIYWSYGGLESTLVSFTAIFLILTVSDYIGNNTNPRFWRAIFAIVLFGIVRPETPILLGCILGSFTTIAMLKEYYKQEMDKPISSPLLRLFVMYLLICVGIFAFRLWYFGDMFPQPVAAKVGDVDLVSLTNGINYVNENLFKKGFPTALLSYIFATGLFTTLIFQVKTGSFNIYLIFSLLYILGYISFTIFTGGDWMEGGRFLVHFISVLIIMTPVAIASITRNKLPLILITFLVFGLEIKSLVEFTKISSTGVPVWSQIKTSRYYRASEYSWFERHNRINMRDVYIIDYIDYLVAEISKHHTPVTIMSAQMGIVPYHISMDHFGDVRFIDRAGLTDRAFTTCEVTQDFPKGNSGMGPSYEYYFENFLKIEQVCQITRPDIIFDISASDLTEKLLGDNGYAIKYVQKGNIVSNEKWLEGYIVKGNQILGVRSDLLESLEKIKFVFIKLKE